MKALSIGWVNVKMLLRERSNIFFVFIFPIALVLLIGIQFGSGFEPGLAIHQADRDALSDRVVDALEAEGALKVQILETTDEVITAVERGTVQAGVLLPEGMRQTAADGEVVEIGLIGRTDGTSSQISSVIGASISEVMLPVGAAQFAAAETGTGFDEALAAADGVSAQVERIDVEVSAVGEAIFPASMGRFDLGASSQLTLFTFLTALAGSSALILTRQLGISKRMLSTPTPMRTIIVGESLGRFWTALVQGLYIMIFTVIIFGVDWGDPLGAILILVAFSAVGAGAGMLLGSTFSNDQQAGGIGVVLALGLAALGGAMYPLELFGPTMQRIAHFTPHAWALDAFAVLVRENGGTLDILLELGVLVLYAVVLLALAAWRLRVVITRP